MAVLQMQKFSICALKKNRKEVLELLQAAGVVEVTQEAEEDGVFRKTDTVSSRQMFDRNAALADQALEILQEYVPEKSGMFSALEGKALTDREKFGKVADNAQTVLEDARQIQTLNKQVAEQKAGIAKLETQIEGMTPWLGLDIPLGCQETRSTSVLVGAVAGGATLEQLYLAVAEKAPELQNLDIQVVGADKDQTCIAAICLKRDAEQLEDALRAAGFARPSQTVGEVPAQYVEELRAQIEKLNKDIENTINKLKVYEGSRENLKLLSDYYRIRAQKYEVLGQVVQSEKTFIVTGYAETECEKAGGESHVTFRPVL